jgi:hypothetical protein
MFHSPRLGGCLARFARQSSSPAARLAGFARRHLELATHLAALFRNALNPARRPFSLAEDPLSQVDNCGMDRLPENVGQR